MADRKPHNDKERASTQKAAKRMTTNSIWTYEDFCDMPRKSWARVFGECKRVYELAAFPIANSSACSTNCGCRLRKSRGVCQKTMSEILMLARGSAKLAVAIDADMEERLPWMFKFLSRGIGRTVLSTLV